jgi:hypothetical protein
MKLHSTVSPLTAVFFFGSYEGIRVLQPRIASTYVTSLASRQNSSSAAHPLLDAFPKPTGADLGNGTVAIAAEYSEPSSLDTFSGRIDYLWQQQLSGRAHYNAPPNFNTKRNHDHTSSGMQ